MNFSSNYRLLTRISAIITARNLYIQALLSSQQAISYKRLCTIQLGS